MSSDGTAGGGLIRRRLAAGNSASSSNNNNIISSNEQSGFDSHLQNVTPNDTDDDPDSFNSEDTDPRNVKLSLMEEVFLLGLKDKQGYTSFWNDCISAGLRGCILAELVLRKRIGIEKSNKRKISLHLRKVHVINPANTGDALLDEALKHINDTQTHEDLHSWIHYFSGRYWLVAHDISDKIWLTHL